MIFVNRNVKLLEIKAFTSKSGKDLIFLRLGDPKTFDSFEFFPARGLDLNSLKINDEYYAILSYDGKYASIDLKPIVNGGE